MSEYELRPLSVEDRVRQLEELVSILLAAAYERDQPLGMGKAGMVGHYLALRAFGSAYEDSRLDLYRLGLGAIGPAQPAAVADNSAAIEALKDELGRARQSSSIQQGRIDVLQREVRELKQSYVTTLLQLSRLEALSTERLRRAIGFSVYLKNWNPEQGEALFWALLNLVNEHGFELLDLGSPVQGSWFRRAAVWTRDAVTSAEVTDRLAKVEEALELKHVEQVRAARDKAHSEALLNISKAVEGQDRAAILIGGLAVLKVPGADGESTIVARTLTSEQQKTLEAHPELALDPDALRDLVLGRGHASSSDPPTALDAPGSS